MTQFDKVTFPGLAKVFAKHGYASKAYHKGEIITFQAERSAEEKATWEQAKREAMTDKKEICRDMLADLPDTSADAIAAFLGLKKELARSLCKGMGRATASAHYGNDYETRNYSHF